MSKAIPEPTLAPAGSLGGILFLGEPITLRLLIASSAIPGGVALVIFAKQRTGGKAAS